MRAQTVIALVFAPTALFAQAFHNGSFNEGKFSKGTPAVQVAAGSKIIVGWRVTGSVDWIGSLWRASDGQGSIDLSGTGPGTLSQTFSTRVGRRYLVSFNLAGNAEGAPEVKKMTVRAGTTKPQFYTFSVRGHSDGNMGWVARTYAFVAYKSKSTLTFTSLSNSACGPALCHVRVTEYMPPKVRRR